MNTNGEVAGDLFHLHVYLQQIIFLQLLFAYRWVNGIKTFCRGGGGESLRKKSNLRSTNPSLEQVHIGCTVLCVCAATAGRHTDIAGRARRDWFLSFLERNKVAILDIFLLKCTLCCILSMQGSHKKHVT